MIDVTQDIYSLTTFKRKSLDLMKRMKKSGRPLVLTVNGKAEAVLLDAKDYQHVAEHLDAITNIRQGLLETERGLGQPAKEVFEEIRRETRSRK
ncbi:MAG TPA: type II toxin-antitoxin system Phd/YefM family antitoxin [Terriglobales bacterium]|jgi:prevent-host-death family protein|nr:type II toxin-antitoxin system Phd/YefM family antitoxin [Terriglobales bacterium]